MVSAGVCSMVKVPVMLRRLGAENDVSSVGFSMVKLPSKSSMVSRIRSVALKSGAISTEPVNVGHSVNEVVWDGSVRVRVDSMLHMIAGCGCNRMV